MTLSAGFFPNNIHCKVNFQKIEFTFTIQVLLLNILPTVSAVSKYVNLPFTFHLVILVVMKMFKGHILYLFRCLLYDKLVSMF